MLAADTTTKGPTGLNGQCAQSRKLGDQPQFSDSRSLGEAGGLVPPRSFSGLFSSLRTGDRGNEVVLVCRISEVMHRLIQPHKVSEKRPRRTWFRSCGYGLKFFERGRELLPVFFDENSKSSCIVMTGIDAGHFTSGWPAFKLQSNVVTLPRVAHHRPTSIANRLSRCIGIDRGHCTGLL